jgi:hypothetical protein
VFFAHGDVTTALSMYYNSLNILVVNLPLISVNYTLGNHTKQNQVFGECLELNSDLVLELAILLINEKLFPFCQLCSCETRSRVPTEGLLSLVTLDMQSRHVFWRLYTLKLNTVIM